MNNLIVLPLILPVMMAVILIFFRNYRQVQRIGTLLTLIIIFVSACILVQQVHTKGILRLDFGGWEPPYGILFVADPLSALLVAMASFVTICFLLYAFVIFESTQEKMFIYPLILLMLAGVNGSFLTGDIFNLFVCFEVMLLASYGLISFGGGKERLREALKYVLINVVASWFFLVALAFVYGTLGTLNMAHLAERVQEAGQTPLLTTVSLFLLIVFALKAGLLLFFWLPGAYSVPTAPISALFGGLLTKVGVYALIRTFTLIFPYDMDVTHTLIRIMAIITILLGCAGALAYKDIRQIVAYNVIIAVGFMLLGLSAANEAALQGIVYYILHDILVKVLLFLCAATIFYVTGKYRYDEMSGLIRTYPLFGWIFFIAMLALAGIPPLSGFVGKVLIVQGLIEDGAHVALFVAVASSLAVLLSLLKIFLHAIFGESTMRDEKRKPIPKSMLVALTILMLASFGLGIFAQFLVPYIQEASTVLLQPSIYIDAVLGGSR